AEDGIRDLIVTGVQTCALPISIEVVGLAFLPARDAAIPAVIRQGRGEDGSSDGDGAEDDTGQLALANGFTMGTSYGMIPFGAGRSEERRVGKECRSRGGADHYK